MIPDHPARNFDGAAPAGSLFLVAGLGQAFIPMTAACSLYVASSLPSPMGPLSLDASGDLLFAATLPASLSIPFTLTLQAIEIDPLAVNGFANTNGVQIDLEANAYAPLFPVPQLSVGSHPRSLAIADSNGDSQPDLVTANQGSSDVSVLIHQ